ncbi:MAG: hypothetical protein QOD31_3992, partial [Pseudonocardiales bacterium]|nr:hypothetical protein [Pseudonocardiales bacterium]
VTVHSVVVSISGDGVPTITDFPPPVQITSPASGATVATPTPTDVTSTPASSSLVQITVQP